MNWIGVSRIRRQTARRRGVRAEHLAAWWLRLKGYRVIDRDVQTPAGQIDLVVRRGSVLAIVEVKHRGDMATALESVTRRQQIRLARAAEVLLGRRPAWASLNLRFDAVFMVPGHWPRHVADAWRAES